MHRGSDSHEAVGSTTPGDGTPASTGPAAQVSPLQHFLLAGQVQGLNVATATGQPQQHQLLGEWLLNDAQMTESDQRCLIDSLVAPSHCINPRILLVPNVRTVLCGTSISL